MRVLSPATAILYSSPSRIVYRFYNSRFASDKRFKPCRDGFESWSIGRTIPWSCTYAGSTSSIRIDEGTLLISVPTVRLSSLSDCAAAGSKWGRREKMYQRRRSIVLMYTSRSFYTPQRTTAKSSIFETVCGTEEPTHWLISWWY